MLYHSGPASSITTRAPAAVSACAAMPPPAPERKMVDVGTGTIDFATLIREGRRVGLQGVYVEHDNPTDALTSARVGFDHLRRLMS